MCAMAENTLILANHPLLRNFSFYKITDITVFSGKKTEPQFCIKIAVQIWWREMALSDMFLCVLLNF